MIQSSPDDPTGRKSCSDFAGAANCSQVRNERPADTLPGPIIGWRMGPNDGGVPVAALALLAAVPLGIAALRRLRASS